MRLVACLYVIVQLVHLALGADCPDETLIAPCDCLNNMIHCGRGVSDLAPVFDRLSAGLEEKFFDQFILRDSDVTELPANVFRDLAFRKIDIQLNNLLERIDHDAFVSTAASIESVNLQNNFNLGTKGPDNEELFKALSTLSNVVDVNLLMNGFEVIPANAFSGVQSKFITMTISGFSIKQIGENAFSRLTNLTHLILYRTSLTTFPPNSIDIGGSPGNTIPVDFRLVEDVQLTAESFQHDKSNWLNVPSSRPLALTIMHAQTVPTMSSINYLDQCAFAGILRQNPNNTISIGSLDCSNCENSWIVKNNYQGRVRPVAWRDCQDIDNPQFAHCSDFVRVCPL